MDAYEESFDIGVALHACGEASDLVLRKCGAARAAFCVAPCCVGKLNTQRHNPYIYQSTADNAPTISYPQSNTFSNLLAQNKWDTLARAADYSDMMEIRTPRNATRRTAKALLETDRLLFMQERYGYRIALTRMDPWESSPKNDILLGWHEDVQSDRDVSAISPYQLSPIQPCQDCNADVQLSMRHLLGAPADGEMIQSIAASCQETHRVDSVDWTWQEEESIRTILQEFAAGSDERYIFPTAMGSRRRKIVHYVAEHLGLRHWSQGETNSEKTVVVAQSKTIAS